MNQWILAASSVTVVIAFATWLSNAMDSQIEDAIAPLMVRVSANTAHRMRGGRFTRPEADRYKRVIDSDLERLSIRIDKCHQKIDELSAK